jgi:hypothetical protein
VGLLFFLIMALGSDKAVEVRFTETPPVIDGSIEDVWQQADSAFDFVQFEPNEKQAPVEKTSVYVLQDKENIYFAFRCYADSVKPIECLTSDEDWISIGIDPFESKTAAYYFIVYASAIRQDGWVMDDGRSRDESWEGVWYRGIGFYDDRYEVEIKIPFKSIRHRKGLERWGLQFARYYAKTRETDMWVPVTQLEGQMVSKYGSLIGVSPQVRGYYFELYPEGFMRYNCYAGEEGDFEPRLSMNFKWDITPQTTLNATTYPDFSQIESDPFTLNLSQYPTLFDERRPFFIEGTEIFHLSDFGEDRGFFTPLNIFYSRRIGKPIGEQAVPIIAGTKLTAKSNDWNAGILATYTDEYSLDESLSEPARRFGVFRIKRRQFGNSEIGLLFSGTSADSRNYNYAAGFDGAFRKGVNQLIVQGAASTRSGKEGWAVTSGYFGLVSDFMTTASIEVIDDSFDVSDIGYVPWSGRKKFTLMSGPYRTYNEGALRNLYIAPSVSIVKEPGQKNWSTTGSLTINPNFRNSWGFNLEGGGGRVYEADTNYVARSVSYNMWANLGGQFFDGNASYSYGYNYARGFPAYQAHGYFRVARSFIPEVRMSVTPAAWAEWDTANSLLALTTLATPRLDYRMSSEISIAIFNEFVFYTPETEFSETEWLSSRLGGFFSWNFRPKSWLYLALNDYREEDDSGRLNPVSTVAAVKAKYLIYF